jgi:tryptophan synthase alpha chain
MKENKLSALLKTDKKDLLSIYVTAGYPSLGDTGKVILNSEQAGVDLMEIGIPFSDPLADGPVIQESSQKALDNGMSLNLLFEQLEEVKNKVKIPLLLMGYYNSILQFGIEKFCQRCSEVGVSGLIIPDLPLDIYRSGFKKYTEKHNLHNILLITPQTSRARIKEMDDSSTAFIYAVSSASTTGSKSGISDSSAFLKRLQEMKLKHLVLTGFNISNRNSYLKACEYSRGAIIGSAFIKAISGDGELGNKINSYIKSILEK